MSLEKVHNYFLIIYLLRYSNSKFIFAVISFSNKNFWWNNLKNNLLSWMEIAFNKRSVQISFASLIFTGGSLWIRVTFDILFWVKKSTRLTYSRPNWRRL